MFSGGGDMVMFDGCDGPMVTVKHKNGEDWLYLKKSTNYSDNVRRCQGFNVLLNFFKVIPGEKNRFLVRQNSSFAGPNLNPCVVDETFL